MHVLSRRRFLTSLVITLAPLGAAPGAQEYKAGKVFRVGALGVGSPELLRQGLRELGYVEGLNLVIESRDAERKTSAVDVTALTPSWLGGNAPLGW
jgi:hypothetical protein